MINDFSGINDAKNKESNGSKQLSQSRSVFHSPDDETPSVVSARGTEDGLVLRIDGKAEWSLVVSELDAFLGGKKRFFDGGEISVEWLERLPTKEQSAELESYLKSNFGLSIVQRKRKLARLLKAASSLAQTSVAHSVSMEGVNSKNEDSLSSSLFDDLDEDRMSSQKLDSHSESLLERVERLASGDDTLTTDSLSFDGPISFASGADLNMRNAYTERVSQFFGSELLMDEEANARVIYGTLRSGQRVETPFSLIVVGDVNPGADLIAGGDVVVLGSLRGTAHAGAYDDDMVNRAIIALQMQPVQLRIGSVVSRGTSESAKLEASKGPEMARIDNRTICVEPYSARVLASRKPR